MTDGIRADTLEPWLAEHVEGLVPPLSFELITGGHSNLTYKVTDAAGHSYALRRPPLGQVLATAHDMGREHRAISALGPTTVPVPPALAFCDDEAVNGPPFYVMGFVEGRVIGDRDDARQRLTEDERRAAGESLVDVLADLHAIDPDEVGIGDLGRREAYVERQLRRWYRQWEAVKTREIPAVDDVYARLLDTIPEQGPATIVHGDYRLGNTMLGPDGRLVAVFDWELCTLGDPLADVGYLMATWYQPAPPGHSPPDDEGFPPLHQALDRYANRSGRDLSTIDFYVAFQHWRWACIVEGVYARYVGGGLGDHDEAEFSHFAHEVEQAAAAAAEAAARI